MADMALDLIGLKCPLPVLRTRKALATLTPGDTLIASATDPLAQIDIPNMLRETGDQLKSAGSADGVFVFTIVKR